MYIILFVKNNNLQQQRINVQRPFLGRYNTGQPVPELSETLFQCTILTVLKFQIPDTHSQPSLPGLSVYLWALILRRTRGKQLEET